MKVPLQGIAISMAALMMIGPTLTLAADGEAIYSKSCAACHANLPPKLGDKAAWESRLKQGINGMVSSVMKGKGAMPAKGGNTALSEADITAAVEYMVAQIK